MQGSDLSEQRASRAEARQQQLTTWIRGKVLGSNQSLSGSCENRHFLKKKKKVKVKVLNCRGVSLSFPSAEVTFKGPKASLRPCVFGIHRTISCPRGVLC